MKEELKTRLVAWYRASGSLFAVLLSLSTSGCIVLGFDPKTEIRTHERLEPVFATPSDCFSYAVVSAENPIVSVSYEDGNRLRVDVEVNQSIVRKNAQSFYKEKWKIEDGRAWSIGIIPGNGPVLFTGKLFSTDTNGWDVVSFTIATPIGNAFMLGIPTIASLLGGLGDTDTIANFGLVGACAFDTGKPIGDTMVEQKIEHSFNNSGTNRYKSKSLCATILTTVEIPSLWYRETIVMPPIHTRDGKNYAVFNLPPKVPKGTKGTVRLSFIDESAVYGKTLVPYQGMVSHFEL